MSILSLFGNSKMNSVNGECDYPSNIDALNRNEFKDHPIQCATCELVAQALENWMIDPTDEQAVRIFE